MGGGVGGGDGGGGEGGSGCVYTSTSAAVKKPNPTCRSVTYSPIAAPQSYTYGAGSTPASYCRTPHDAVVAPSVAPTNVSTVPNDHAKSSRRLCTTTYVMPWLRSSWIDRYGLSRCCDTQMVLMLPSMQRPGPSDGLSLELSLAETMIARVRDAKSSGGDSCIRVVSRRVSGRPPPASVSASRTGCQQPL